MQKNSSNFVTKVGIFAAIAFFLQLLGSIIGIKVSGFLDVEISDLPAMIVALAVGPFAGVMVEFIKNLLHCLMTSTGFVGEFANFVINGIFVFVCGSIYKRNKSKKGAVISLITATLALTVAGILVNLFIMLPLYIKDADFLKRLNIALYVIAPFNLVRGGVLSVITMFIYKRISRFIK